MTPMRFGTRFLGAFRRTVVPLALLFGTASPAWAVLDKVVIFPATPTPCDTIIARVTGTLPSTCYEIIGASVRGPETIPCMRPGPCPSQFHIDIIVREPNPDVMPPCAISPPYERTFDLPVFTAGEYTVITHERVVPFSVTDSIVSESFLTTAFVARPDSVCPPVQGCYVLALAGDRPPGPLCLVTTAPGGTACLNLVLQNQNPVAGLQTTLQISDLTKPLPGLPILSIPVASVQPVGRAAGFQVSHTEEGGKTKLILYSTSGATIEPGFGPVVRICYAIPPEPVPSTLRVDMGETIVADALGNGVPPCPTVATGFTDLRLPNICIEKPGCDLNGDGVSDVLDIIRLVRCALTSRNDSTPACPDSIAARADCNGDGTIDIRDVICCVRKIVASRPEGGTALGIGPAIEGRNSIGFEGPAQWVNEVDGIAVLRINTATDWGGTEFQIDASGARIRNLRVLDPGASSQLEWAVDGSGSARGMLFTSGVGPPRGGYRVEVMLERSPGPGATLVHLTRIRAGTWMGDPATIQSFNPDLQISAAPVTSPMLLKARPNPSASGTEIGFVLPAEARVSLRIYDVSGRLVRTLVDGPRTTGVHRVQWDGTDDRGRTARSGIYFAKLEAGTVKRSERVLLMR